MLKSVSSTVNAIGALNYKGTWNASTNTPALASGVGTKGDYYQVSVAGSTALDGISNWGVGDVVAFNGTTWQRIEGGADGNFVNLTATGTAGFGTATTPQSTVDAASTTTADVILGTVRSAPAGAGESYSYFAARKDNAAAGGAYYGMAMGGGIKQGTGGFGILATFNNSATPSKRVWLNTATGHVGVGGEPAVRLHVQEANFAILRTQNTAGGNVVCNMGSDVVTGNAYVGTSSNNALRLTSNNADRMVFQAAGNVEAGADNTQTLGTAGKRWSEIFAGNPIINTSDRNEKEQIEELDDAERRVALKVKSLVRKYKFKDAVAAKGDLARIHIGVIAQDVASAFESEGLDPSRYSLFCSDTFRTFNGEAVEVNELNEYVTRHFELDGQVVAPDDNGELPDGAVLVEQHHATQEQTKLGIRYNELLAFIIAAI